MTKTKHKPFIRQVVGKPGTGEATITFRNGVTTHDVQCGQFFMMAMDKGWSVDDAKAYANIGPMMSPNVDWVEINRVLATL